MFEQDIIYKDIKGKKIQVICESDIKIEGVCIFNPEFVRKVNFYSMYHCLSIKVEDLPDLLTIWQNNSCYVTDNNHFPYEGHILYIPFKIIKDIHVVKTDWESKIMLRWVCKNKTIPREIANEIKDYMSGWKRNIKVIDY